ncbi:MAG: beta-lactamase family protein [Bacteroidia bacterium]|nr:beta-lactamase family protein [Bacteroidia bacterium]
MKKYFITILFLPLLTAAQQKAERFDSLFKAHPDFSGVILAAGNNNIIYHSAFGLRDFSKQTLIKKSDIFELASVSKQFTAMIIMMLKEKGLLDYDDRIEKYLDVPYKLIKIRHLLTHTSGLPDYQEVMDKYWDKSKVAGNDDCIEYLNRYAPPKLFEPGEKYEYSNTGYLLLASIAEKASGRDFIDLCREWIFRPLKMKNTDIRSLSEKAEKKNFVLGHIYIEERDKYIRADSFPSSDYTIWLGNRKGPGRISAPAIDLLRWDHALYNNKLVKAETLEEAFSPMKLNNDSLSGYGFGWILRKHPALGKIVMHTGSNPGFSTIIVRMIERKKTIILFSNNEYGNFGEIVRQAENILGYE